MLWTVYGPTLTLWAGLAFVNLFAACYAIGRTVFLEGHGAEARTPREATAQRVAALGGTRAAVGGVTPWSRRSSDDREPEASGPSRAGGSSPAPPREDDWRARFEAGLAPPGGERFLVVRWHERIVTVSPSEQGTLRTLSAYRTIAAPDLATHRYAGDRARFSIARCDGRAARVGPRRRRAQPPRWAARRPC